LLYTEERLLFSHRFRLKRQRACQKAQELAQVYIENETDSFTLLLNTSYAVR
jgi:hypothetical protein